MNYLFRLYMTTLSISVFVLNYLAIKIQHNTDFVLYFLVAVLVTFLAHLPIRLLVPKLGKDFIRQRDFITITKTNKFVILWIILSFLLGLFASSYDIFWVVAIGWFLCVYKTTLFAINPLFLLSGYDYYRGDLLGGKRVIVITRSNIFIEQDGPCNTINGKITHRLDNYTFFG